MRPGLFLTRIEKREQKKIPFQTTGLKVREKIHRPP